MWRGSSPATIVLNDGCTAEDRRDENRPAPRAPQEEGQRGNYGWCRDATGEPSMGPDARLRESHQEDQRTDGHG